jgi:hypothetical protein
MDDLLGLFGDGGHGGAPAQMSNDDIMNGFANMSMQTSQPPPPQQQQQQQAGAEASKKSNQDLLDLF